MENRDKEKVRIKDLEREIERLRKTLKEKDRVSNVGRQMAGMDHYIKNILNKLEGGSYMVNTGMRRNKSDIVSRGWSIVETNLSQVSDLVMNLLLVSKEPAKNQEWCSPNDIAQDVFDQLGQRGGNHRVALAKAFEPDMDEYYLGVKEVHRCLLNIGTYIVETCDTVSDQGEPCTLLLKTVKAEEGIRFEIIVDGADLPDAISGKFIERIDPAEGKEFGLIVARHIAEGEGGTISLETGPGKGFTFTLYFPSRVSE